MNSRVFELEKEVPRLGARAEILATWYLRFNGYFPISGFILHDAGATKQPGGQITDSDILAVRFPQTVEIIKGADREIVVQTHHELDVRAGLMDFVIADVSSHECKCNQMDADGTVDADFIRYCLRRFGYWADARIPELVERISTTRILEGEGARVRLLAIGVTENAGLAVAQIAFDRVLRYMRDDLFNCYDGDLGDKMIVSDHKQWHPLIREVYRRLRGHKKAAKTPEEIVRWLFPDSVAARRPAQGARASSQ